MTKPERKIVEKLLTCLDGPITQVPASKQELLDELAKSPFFAHVAFHNSQMVWDKKRVMTEIKLLSEPCWQSLLMRLAEELRRAARERELEDELTAELEARFPHEDVDRHSAWLARPDWSRACPARRASASRSGAAGDGAGSHRP